MEIRKIFPKWDETDEKCPACGHITKRTRGFTKQNLKRLITPKMDLNEFILTLSILMVLILAWLYIEETKECRTWIKNLKDDPWMACKILTECEKTPNGDYECGLKYPYANELERLNVTFNPNG